MYTPDTQRVRAVEWPTLVLLLANYGIWVISLVYYASAPLLFSLLMCFALALQSSLVHELIHGHPTHVPWLNAMLGVLPLTLFYPYHLFRETHLKHHEDDNLTLPGIDPESFFHCPIKWRRTNRLARAIAWINMTLAGRLLLSVPCSMKQVLTRACGDLWHGSAAQRSLWLLHIVLLAFVVAGIIATNGMPFSIYLLCAVVAHMAIALRAFFEHQPASQPQHRVVVVQSNRFFQLLFLGNNFHAVHHAHPALPWYAIPRFFSDSKETVLHNNNRFYFAGYTHWLRYLLRPVHSPVHPGTPHTNSGAR